MTTSRYPCLSAILHPTHLAAIEQGCASACFSLHVCMPASDCPSSLLTLSTAPSSSSHAFQTACFAGPTVKPITPLCCDSYTQVSQCPAGSIDTSKYSSVIGQPVNSDACSAFTEPPPAIPPALSPTPVSPPTTPAPSEAPTLGPSPPVVATPPVVTAVPPTPPPSSGPEPPSLSPLLSQSPAASAPAPLESLPPSVSPAPPPQPSINRDVSAKNAAVSASAFQLVLLSLVALTLGLYNM